MPRKLSPFGPCSYCGIREAKPANMHMDHFVPKKLGGSNSLSNLVAACYICNAIKGSSRFDYIRTRLVQKRLGWPLFTEKQLEWLRERGFDTAELDTGTLAFEDDQ